MTSLHQTARNTDKETLNTSKLTDKCARITSNPDDLELAAQIIAQAFNTNVEEEREHISTATEVWVVGIPITGALVLHGTYIRLLAVEKQKMGYGSILLDAVTSRYPDLSLELDPSWSYYEGLKRLYSRYGFISVSEQWKRST